MTVFQKPELLRRGIVLAERFCWANEIPVPAVTVVDPAAWQVSACAYYRRDRISICPARCAGIGVAGRAWSYPGYTVDRTPYGVIQHELGHHVDLLRARKMVGPYFSDYSMALRAASGEPPLTSYCPNDAEWFAEHFRLFVTNPDLLEILRPKTFARLIAHWKPVVTDSWDVVLRQAPERTIAACKRKMPAIRPRIPPLFPEAIP